MNLCSFLSPALIGLDIQPDCIRLVQCKKISHKFHVLNVAATNLPDGVFHEGKIVAWDIFQLALTKFIENSHVSGEVAVSLPAHLVRMQNIQLPADLTDGEIENEINSHMQRDLPGMLDALCIDFAAAPRINSGHMDVFFAATRKEYLCKYIDCINRTALQVSIVDVDMYALKRAICFALPAYALTVEMNAVLYSTKLMAILLIFDSWNVVYHQQWDRTTNDPDQIIQLCFNSMRHIKINELIICGEYLDEYISEKKSLQFYSLNPFNQMHLANDLYQAIADPSHFLMACGLAMREVTKW